MATVKKPARQLGLDDLRYVVQIEGTIGTTSSTARTRYIGSPILIEGPVRLRNADIMKGHPNAYDSYVTVHLAAGPRDTVRVIVPADDEVTVDRAPRRSVHDLPAGSVR